MTYFLAQIWQLSYVQIIMSHTIPEKISNHLQRWEKFRYYNEDLQYKEEKITGWKLWSEKPDIWYKYSFPTIEEINEFEKLQGWNFPESLRVFLTTIGRSVLRNFKFFFMMEDGRELEISTFYGLVEMVPVVFGEYPHTGFGKCSLPNGKFCTLRISQNGQIILEESAAKGLMPVIAQSFEEFLEKLELRKVD